MNDENKIDLSIEMYEDLKETLVKAIKNAKTGKTDGSIHSDNAQTERIERLIEAAELSQRQIAQLLEHLQRHTALPGIKTEQVREFTDRYNTLLAQLAGKLEVIDKENRQTHTLIEQVGQAVEALAKPDTLPVQEHRYIYTPDIKSSKTFLTMFVMLGGIFRKLHSSTESLKNNRLLAVNDPVRYGRCAGKSAKRS